MCPSPKDIMTSLIGHWLSHNWTKSSMALSAQSLGEVLSAQPKLAWLSHTAA